MARTLTFEIITKAQTKQLAALSRLLQDITKKSKALNSDVGIDNLEAQFNNLNRTIKVSSDALGKAGVAMKRDLGDQAKRAAKDVESLQTQLKDMRRDTSRLDTLRRNSKKVSDDLADSERRLAKAQSDAQTALNKYRTRKDARPEEAKELETAYKRAQAQVTKLTAEHDKLGTKLRDEAREIVDIDRRYSALSQTLNSISPNIVKKLVTPADARSIRDHARAIDDLTNVYKETFNVDRGQFGKLGSQLGLLRGQVTQLGKVTPVIRNFANEYEKMAKLDQRDLLRGIGNPQQALTAASRAIQQQNEESIKLRGNMDRLNTSNNRWVEAEREAARVMSSGNSALAERTRVTRMFTNALSGARGAETTFSKNLERLRAQQRQYADDMVDLTNRINRAQTDTVSQTAGSAAQREAATRLNDLREAYSRLDAAMDQNTANIRQNEAAMQAASSQVASITQSQQNWQSVIRSVSNPMQAMIAVMQRVTSIGVAMATTLGGRLRSAISAVAGASKSFVGSVGSMFSGLQRALQGVGNAANSFAAKFERSMDRAHAATMELYAAGFALMSLGRDFQQFGMQGFRAMGQSLDEYMSYERRRIQAAVAGSESAAAYQARTGQQLPEGQGYRIDNRVLDDLIFSLQRGVGIPWMNQGRPIPVTFSAEELAQGLYYYSSAIGVPITDENQSRIGAQMATIMQAAAVTNTGLETAVKGVMNIAMEFGFDPRAVGDMTISADARDAAAEQISKIAAQMAYLSNISTMEMSDIVETFKMVGPMANILSGGQPGAGLDETFLMSFLASEVGLRGGNVGRGLNRAFSSMLDPTPKMIEAFSKFFPDEIYDVESFRDKFFEAGTDTLKGGIIGFMESLASLPIEKQASALAELFTENATRTLVGTTRKFLEDEGGLDKWIAEIEGDNPFEWLGEAAAATANSVSGWFAFMKNGWFQFQASIIGSVSGPLMKAFHTIGEVLFEIAERIQVNPAIGRVIASIVGAISSFAVIVGTIMLVAGAILLLGRAFAMAGGFIAPFLRMVVIAGATFAALIPLFAALAVGAGLLIAAFQANLFGIQDAWTAFTGTFDNFEDTWAVWISNTITGLGRLGMVFDEFVNGIIIGQGTTNNLNAFMQAVFGPLLGNVMIVQLGKLRSALDDTRESVRSFLSGTTFNVSTLQHAGAAIQGFMEQFFLGTTSERGRYAQNMIGQALGIDDLPATVARYADGLRQFLVVTTNFAADLVGTWASISREIFSNIGRIFAQGGLDAVMVAMGDFAQGIATGILGAITLLLSAVEIVTDKMADFADSLRAAEAQGRTFLGMSISFTNAMRVLGMTIGLFFGARLVMMFSPLARMFVALIPIVTTVMSLFVGLGARILVIAANIAIATAAFVGHIAIMAALAAIHVAAAIAQATYTAASAAAGSSTALNTGLIGILTTAYGILTGSVTVAAGAVAAFGAVLTVAAGIAILIVGVFGGIALAVTMVAGAMLIAVGITQGWGAAWQGLLQFLSGVWTGLQLGISVIMAWVDALQSAASWVGNLVGIGNNFAAMGLVVGGSISLIIALLSVLVVALAGVGVAMATAWIIGLGPIGIIIAAILAIGAAIGVAILKLKSMGVEFDSAWDMIVQGAKVAGVKVAEALTNGLIDGFNQVIDLSGKYSGFGKYVGLFGGDDSLDSVIPHVDWSSGMMEGYEQQAANRQSQLDEFYRYNPELQVSVVTSGQTDSFMGFLDSMGVGGQARELMISLGIDPNNFSLGDLNPENLERLFQIPDNVGALEDFDWSMLGPNGAAYEEAESSWKEYQDLIDYYVESRGVTMAEATQLANSYYAEMGKAIPTEPIISDYLQSEADAMGKSADEIEQHIADITAAFEGLKGMSAEDYLGAVLDPLAGVGGKSLASWFAGGGGNSIMEALGDNAPWMNQMELMADVAGTGLDMSANAYGENMHRLLTPYLEILSQQTGVDIQTMLADIPKFIAPEEFMGVAAGDLMMGINTLGPELFKVIDTLGMDMMDSLTGLPMEEFGLEWAELQAYAVGQAVAGQDWNLADYLSDSWGISVAEAEDYLAAHGIDPNVISDSWFEATEAAALTGNGAYSAMTDEMYEFLKAETNDFATNVITMTEAEWNRIPPAYRAVMANMGITTIIDEGFLPTEALTGAQARIGEFEAMVQTLGTTIGRAGANYQMEGDPRAWLKVDEIVSATGEVMVVIEDLDGTQVTIPAAEYEAYLFSLNQVKNATTNFIEDYKQLLTPIQEGDTVGNLFLESLGIGTGMGATGGGEAAPIDIGKALGLPSAAEASAYGTEIATAVTNAISTGITSSTVDISAPFNQMGTNAATAFSAGLSLTLTGGDLFGAIAIGLSGSITSQFSAMGQSAGQAFSTALRSAMSGAMTSVGSPSGMGGMGMGGTGAPMGGGSGFKISITADTSAVTQAISEIQMKLSYLSTGDWPIRIGIQMPDTDGPADIQADLEALTSTTWAITVGISLTGVENFNSLATQLNTINGSPAWTVTINVVVNLGDNWNTLRDSLANISSSTWTVTIATAGTPSAIGAIVGVQGVADALVGTYNATITSSGTPSAIGAIVAVQAVADALVGTYTATVNINDRASGPLRSINLLLNSISGRNVTATANITTTRTNITKNLTQNVPTAASGGWRSGGQAVLVGEEGPELVYFPTNGYVYDAPATSRMAQALGENPMNSGTGRRSTAMADTSVQNNAPITTLNFYGDIVIQDRADADRFFEQLDRKMGRKTEMARRGMIAVDDTRSW